MIANKVSYEFQDTYNTAEHHNAINFGMKRKQVKLSSFLSPDGPQVHETQPKKEPTSSSWSTVQKDDFVPKKRVLPNTFAKSALSSGYDGNYTSNNPSKTVSSFRPADRMDDGSYVVRPQVTEPKPKKKTLINGDYKI